MWCEYWIVTVSKVADHDSKWAAYSRDWTWLDTDQWNVAGQESAGAELKRIENQEPWPLWNSMHLRLSRTPGRRCDCLDREDQSSMCFVHQIILRLAFRTRKQLQQIKLVQLHYEIRGCKAIRGQHIFKHHHLHGHPPMSVNVLKWLKPFENHEAEQRADTWGCSRPVFARCLGTCCISQTILDLPCVAL